MQTIKLIDVCEFVRNGANIKQLSNETRGIPITRIETLANDRFNRDRLGYANITDDSFSDYYLKRGDVLLSHINGAKFIGRSVIYEPKEDETIIHGMNLLCLRFKSNYNPKFFCYYAKSKAAKNYFDKHTKKAVNQASITSTDIKNMPIPDLTIDEQNKIVHILDLLYSQIDLIENEDKLFDELIKARFNDMFVDKGYGKTKIRNVVDTKKISAKKMYKKDDTILYIDISSIDNSTNQVIGYTPYLYKDAPSRAQQCLMTNDILVSTVRPNLKNIAIFRGESKVYVGSSGFCVLRPTKCNPLYLKYIVLDNEFTETMVDLTTGANYPAIRDDDVLNYEMIDSSIELQNKFASFVELIVELKSALKEYKRTTKELIEKTISDCFFEYEED